MGGDKKGNVIKNSDKVYLCVYVLHPEQCWLFNEFISSEGCDIGDD